MILLVLQRAPLRGKTLENLSGKYRSRRVFWVAIHGLRKGCTSKSYTRTPKALTPLQLEIRFGEKLLEIGIGRGFGALEG